MNYRHGFHAGNHADVLKHAVLGRILEHLKRKDKAFRVIDTHAGPGFYDLRSDMAARSGEWQGGIGALFAADPGEAEKALLGPLFEAVAAANPKGGLKFYPGSPWITRHLLRVQDRLTAIELHPQDAKSLKTLFAGDFQVRVIELNGWLALKAQLPPKEKRGLVLVDPPFEEPGEFGRLVDGLVQAHDRWPGGTYALWYPLKDRSEAAAFRRALRETGIAKILDIELSLRGPSPELRLDGSGVIVVNPPHTLEADMRALLPVFAQAMALGPGAGWTLEWLAGEGA